ncbi:hypothetical protein [Phocaeicola vulgatus]|uniref:hypothetical protein n=2 Tax=Phocaeicola vulgatus TaxID=821 RepID=UPI0034A3807B
MVSVDFILYRAADMWLCNWIVTCLKVKIEYVVCFFSLLMMGIMVALKFKLFGFQFIAWYFPFYAIGFFGRKYQYLWEKRGRVDSLWFSALFLCMAYWWMRKDPPLFMPPSSHVVYNYVYKFMVAGVAIAAFIPLFKYYVNKPLLIFTKWGGGGNIGYLCYPSDNYHPAYVVVQYCLLAIALLAVCMLLVGDGFGYKLFVLSAD